MWQQLPQWLTLPIFSDDPEKTFRARLLYAIATMLMLMSIGNMYFLFTSSKNLAVDFLFATILIIVLGFCLHRARQGQVRLAGLILSLILWVVVTAIIHLYGPQDVIANSYILLIIIATLLNGSMGSFISVAISILSFTAIVFAESSGLREPSLPSTLPVILRMHLQFYVAVGLLLYGADRVIAQALARSRQNELAFQASEKRLNRLLAEAPISMVLATYEGHLFMVNEAMCQMLGYTEAELLGKNFHEIIHPDDTARSQQMTVDILAGKTDKTQYELRCLHQNKEVVWTIITIQLIQDELTSSSYFMAQLQDISQRKWAEATLQARLSFETLVATISANFITLRAEEVDNGIEEALKCIAEQLDAVHGLVFLFSDDLQTVSNTHEWSAERSYLQKGQLQNFQAHLFGGVYSKLKRLESVVVNYGDELPLVGAGMPEWDQQPGFRAMLFLPMILGDKLVGALSFYKADGQGEVWSEEYVSLLQLVADIIANALARKQVEEQINATLREKEVLLKEIHHRVKNNMQVISSLLDLQADYIEDESVRVILQDCRSRVRSMAMVHEQLYRSPDLAHVHFGDYLHDLTTYLLRLYGNSDVSLSLAVEEMVLSVETAVPLGLIVTELVTNACKHAFPDGRSGQIWVQFTTVDDQQMELTIRDDGIGLPRTASVAQFQSLGLMVVQTLVKQIKGTLEWDGQAGTSWYIRLPGQNPTTYQHEAKHLERDGDGENYDRGR